MIRGIGLDIVDIERMERSIRSDRFRERVYTPAERELLLKAPQPAQWAAGRFAAKEAVAKALGCGLSMCPPGEVEILPDALGAPKAILYGRAAERLRLMGGSTVWVSITHDGGHAVAQAVVEGENEIC